MKQKYNILNLIIICFLIFSLPMTTYAAQKQSYIYDNWGKSIPAPVSYIVDQIYSGQDLKSEAFNNPQDIFVSSSKKIYIVDKGDNKIIVLSQNFDFIQEIKEFATINGSETFLEPTGIFVDGEENIYIADSGNQRIVEINKDSKLIRIFNKPETDLLDKSTEFKPQKVVVDNIGNVYAVGYGIYQGLIKYDKNGKFDGFFGGNKVEVTPDLVVKQFWKKMFSDEQAQATTRSLPIEYGNAFIDENNFIYTVVMQTKTSLDEIKKLNAQGKNVLRFSDIGTHYAKNDFGDIEKFYSGTTTYKDNRIVDVCVDNSGIISVLDGERGHIFIYDQDCNLLFVFGESGSGSGAFRQPVAIAKLDNKYLILDTIKKSVMVYKPTQYAQLVLEAMDYYSDGRYIESVDMWKEILKQNSNCLIAYKSIGKAYYQQGNNALAMEYFKNGDDKEGYSNAFAEYRKEFVRDNIYILLILFIILLLILKILYKLLRRFFRFNVKKFKSTYS